METDELTAELVRRRALIVHCSRPGRGGEIGTAKPLYPDDLRLTIRDLQKGDVRNVSCSIIWPEHQEAFGSVGIILKPRSIADITGMKNDDAAWISEWDKGNTSPPSHEALLKMFDPIPGCHNEINLRGAETVGLFISPIGTAEVARYSEELQSPAPVPISFAQFQADFPNLPCFTFWQGALARIAPGHPPDLDPKHPLSLT